MASSGWRQHLFTPVQALLTLALLLLLPMARWLTLATGTPRGSYPFFSLRGYRWASYNALTLMLRFTFIHWIRVTPLLPVFHRLMGMRVGARVQINTAVVSDQNLISIDLDVLDPAHCPAVSEPVPGGLSVLELYTLLRCTHRWPAPWVGADIMELAPTLPGAEESARVGAHLALQLLA